MASLLCSLGLLLVVMAAGSLAYPSAPTNTSIPFHDPEPRMTINNDCLCGQKTLSRIVGGQEATPNEYPWMAGLFFFNVQQFCGGSLINNCYILTAAHCTEGLFPNEVTVRLAEHDISVSGETNLVTRSVSRIIPHPKYQAGTEKNDIALLELSIPVTVNSNVMPVCLPPSKPKYGGKKATLTGWGALSSGGPSPNKLQEVDVTVLRNYDCRKSYGKSFQQESMLCAAARERDSCQGDSGGPLVYKDKSNNYDQIGVVSWGIGCADLRYPGVYARVSRFIKWIKKNTENCVYCKKL